MKNLAAMFLAIISVVSIAYADAKEVREQDLPNYKNCRVWRTYKDGFIAGHKNGVAKIYQCGGDISVIEFKNSESEKPFQIQWARVLERDKSGKAVKDVQRIYTRKGDIYILTEYYTDWNEIEKNDSNERRGR